MAKKSKKKAITTSAKSASDLVTELFNEEGYVPVSELDIMHSREKTETPLLSLNCILGGGLPLGTIVEGYGIPASGKSSVLYQTLGIFQKNYPEGLAVIIDTESSVDKQRMKYMGVDLDRLVRVPAITLERGFEAIIDLFKKLEHGNLDIPIFFLWDTIAVTLTDAQLESDTEYSQGMMEKPKIIKRKLAEIMPKLEKHRAVIVILNQVMSKLSNYGSGTESGGGFALKHDQHLQLEFKHGSASNFSHIFKDGETKHGHTRYEGEYGVEKISLVNVKKSKLSSLFDNIPILIDIKNAGIVDIEKSFVEYIFQLNILGSGAWCNANYLLEKYPEECKKFPLLEGSFRRTEVYDYAKQNPAFVKFLQLAFVDQISEMYSYQKEVGADYREKLYNEVISSESVAVISDHTEEGNSDEETL